ncbi:FAD-dependent oxidoreductase [Flavobacterium ginsenosidimutans]|uniref:FAD-dependent oxidoreductase n=1 Tax=Flavobacterium ginsenosidimutans TaxID=687844 RepID=UPI000DAE7025|nr:FAD-dependent oxidoreductase [Flavobacterium ginsenosidimutans]KAF2332926.1 FAD-dependent oxidoreductase [Flavobacterium ginsenosidimutans]
MPSFKLQIIALILSCFVYSSCSKDYIPEKRIISDFESTNGVDNIDLTKEYDVVIYGATAAGIIAAVEVKKSGKSVLLIKPSNTALGGMSTNGLGITDIHDTNILGGLTRTFYHRIKEYYSSSQNWFVGSAGGYKKYFQNGDIMLWFEPKAAQFVFRDIILENQIPILNNERLDLQNGILKNSIHTIESIRMESGLKIKGKIFIDTSYEGDLMAKSGISYTYGRESNSLYKELFNGVRRMSNNDRNQFPEGVKYLGNGLPSYISGNGTADKKIQAFCFRMCLTNVDHNRRDIEKPFDYNEEDYHLLFEYLKTHDANTFFDLMPLPNGKTDSNNLGPISTDYVGQNYNYPDGDYAERELIVANHKRYQIGLLWTLANHPKVPEKIRDFYKQWGLSKDEFVENNNWPNQLYIREGRRMISDYVMTENNCTGKVIAENPIALADYAMDSHIVQRYVDTNGNVKNEGRYMLETPNPYPIDYRSIVPKKSECTNLLVPICLSASRVAYSSIRMEPVYMTLGQVSAVAAILALDNNIPVQDLSYDTLRNTLLEKKMVVGQK